MTVPVGVLCNTETVLMDNVVFQPGRLKQQWSETVETTNDFSGMTVETV